jgi:hypothetical protein
MGALWIRILKGNKCTWLLFCELELNFSAIKGNLNGINPVCSNFWKRFTCYTYTELKAGLPLFKSEPNLIIRHGKNIYE